MGVNWQVEFFTHRPQGRVALVVMIKGVLGRAGRKQDATEQARGVGVAHLLDGHFDIVDIDNGDAGVATGILVTQVRQETVVLLDPQLANLYDDPRWPTFLDKMGLPN